jgi:hypothetical protein
MGESVREGVDPYDGTLYFEDIANTTDVKCNTTFHRLRDNNATDSSFLKKLLKLILK